MSNKPKILKDGWIFKKSRSLHRIRKRWLVLNELCLLSYKYNITNITDNGPTIMDVNQKKYKLSMSLMTLFDDDNESFNDNSIKNDDNPTETIHVYDIIDVISEDKTRKQNKCKFYVKTNKSKFTFYALSGNDRDIWIKCIKDQMNKIRLNGGKADNVLINSDEYSVIDGISLRDSNGIIRVFERLTSGKSDSICVELFHLIVAYIDDSNKSTVTLNTNGVSSTNTWNVFNNISVTTGYLKKYPSKLWNNFAKHDVSNETIIEDKQVKPYELKNILDWDSNDVEDWLTDMNLSQYVDIICDMYQMNGTDIMEKNENDWNKLLPNSNTKRNDIQIISQFLSNKARSNNVVAW
mmetsp:Transcript_102534/g.125356  ORF Transcript_102534/g.125356 Transcript_102534/m.125356 type:complete len:351 (+) Transcript_102534:31-1083(+)